MNTTHPENTLLGKTGAAVLHKGANFLRTPTMKTDAEAILFSAKSFAAAMLAYYIALRIGLPKPFWAIVTVYIVSQTSAGASFSRGMYRFAGTLIGAIATVAIVPNFVNEPIICCVILAGWIGLCLFLSLLDRTPRAYGFVLAGYTASLIGFPSVLDPNAVFVTAAVRVQEISVGILCAVVIHRYILPKRMTGQFTGKLLATMQDARRLAADALNGTPEESRTDRHQLAVDLLTLEGLGTHLPYDPAPVTPRRDALRLIHDRLARLLVLTSEIEDRVYRLGKDHGGTPEELTALLGDIRSWIALSEPGDEDTASVRLTERARSLQKQMHADVTKPVDRISANLAGHLVEMIGLLHDCDRLRRSLTTSGRSFERASLHGPRDAKGYVYHRDPWMAARAALGASVGILGGCAFWMGSAWPEGGMAVSILGVCCTLFGNFDAPVPFVVKYIVGSIHGVVISLIYSFVILPQVTDFIVLVAVLAPAFLLAGSLQARLPTTLMALGITLTIPILAPLGASYTGDFAASLNTVIALFAAVGFAAVSMSLFQTVHADTAINRLLHLSRQDIGRRALGGAPNEAGWTSLMIDRTALLLPRLRASGKDPAGLLDNTLRHLRIGHVAGQLRKVIPEMKGETGARTGELLSAIAACFSATKPTMPADLVDVDQRIGTLMTMMGESANKNPSRILDLLIDLHFALGCGETTGRGKPGS
ncbi:FUSC family protein [Ochrobactrum sp. 695/2009]|nr:FUSC family protein [Ochrobactrum sp. 721/2009]PJT15721.1 FUSC family protein [Ochrobactrum sp. 720/2009]PJT23916.1 FUSC family protein [Ochrobactrum sp. 715/2009]PJT24060.1 FUSC family protein [Ochrobactrum sp. 695/2009]PJT33591.1 FUSC family protein [Ochrobactrum sp. 689/2009]